MHRYLIALCSASLIIMLGACNPAPKANPISQATLAATAVSTETTVPQAKNNASPTPGLTIQTVSGAITVTRTRLVEKWPADCNPLASSSDPSRCMLKAAIDYKIFTVFYDGAPLDQEVINQAYLTEGDKPEQIKSSLSGSTGNEAFFGFTVPAAAEHLVLHWPDNPSIELPPNLLGPSIKATFNLPADWHLLDAGSASGNDGSFFAAPDETLIVAARKARPPQLEPGQAVLQLIIYAQPAPLGIDRNPDRPAAILDMLTSLDESAYKTTFGETQTLQVDSINVASRQGENDSSEVIYYGFFVNGHAAALVGMVAKGEMETSRSIFEDLIRSLELSK